MRKIFLVGMPGAGKSTLGRKIAAALHVAFADLDAEIEKKEHLPVPAIFAEKGEEYFRTIESQILRDWAGTAGSFVLATGGGAPCHHSGMEVINQSGLSIFLDVPVRVLLARVEKEHHRPLLAGTEKEVALTRLLRERRHTYAQSHITITGDHTLEQVLDLINRS